MPCLKKIPLEIESYIFDSKINPKPQPTGFLNFIFKLEKFPLPYFIIRYLLNKALSFSSSISYTRGFKSITGKIYCGENSALGDTFFVDYAPVYIGNNVGFSFRNVVITSTHSLDDFNKIIAKSIIIEDNVWITSNVTILPGVRIGKNSVIGAGSVVVKNIPPDVFAAGNPCKPIKEIKRNIGEAVK